MDLWQEVYVWHGEVPFESLVSLPGFEGFLPPGFHDQELGCFPGLVKPGGSIGYLPICGWVRKLAEGFSVVHIAGEDDNGGPFVRFFDNYILVVG